MHLEREAMEKTPRTRYYYNTTPPKIRQSASAQKMGR